jgi:hypothetical protein
MKMYGGVDVQTHVFLTLALVGSEWAALAPPPGKKATVLLDGPQNQDYMERKKILFLIGIKLRLSAIQPIGSSYTECTVPAPRWQNSTFTFTSVHSLV